MAIWNLFKHNDIITNGAYGVGESEQDFLIGAAGDIPEIKKQDDIRYEYNQGTSNDCTLYGSFGALSDLMNYEFSKDEIKEINELSYSRGRTRGEGWYTRLGVKCVCDWWNAKYPNKTVAYYRLGLLDKEVKEALEKNHTVIFTYRGNKNYSLDYLKDGALDFDDHGTPTYGHCTTMIIGPKVKDSYKGRKGKGGIDCNIYKINASIENLIRNGEYYPTAYIILPTGVDRIEELKRLNEFKVNVDQAIELNSKMRHNTNDEGFKDFLHSINNRLRQKLEDINQELTKYS